MSGRLKNRVVRIHFGPRFEDDPREILAAIEEVHRPKTLEIFLGVDVRKASSAVHQDTREDSDRAVTSERSAIPDEHLETELTRAAEQSLALRTETTGASSPAAAADARQGILSKITELAREGYGVTVYAVSRAAIDSLKG